MTKFNWHLIGKKKVGDRRKFTINGYRDWRLLLYLFCAMVLVLFGVAYYVLLAVKSDEMSQGTPALFGESERRTLDQALKYIADKTPTSATTSPLDFPDPSVTAR